SRCGPRCRYCELFRSAPWRSVPCFESQCFATPRGAAQDSRIVKNTIEKAHVVGRVLLRAPALPARYAFDGGAAADLPSVENALNLATPGLDGKGAARARRRYLARMAFRTAPSGLFSGVAVGELGGKTALASGGVGSAKIGVGRPRILAAAR